MSTDRIITIIDLVTSGNIDAGVVKVDGTWYTVHFGPKKGYEIHEDELKEYTEKHLLKW